MSVQKARNRAIRRTNIWAESTLRGSRSIRMASLYRERRCVRDRRQSRGADCQTGLSASSHEIVIHARPVVIPDIKRFRENDNGLAKQGRLTGLTQYLLQQVDRRILVGGIQVKETRMSEVRHKLILSTGGSQLLAG